ncbi:hypothetical protein L3C95_04490 [Chitinophaga filiformis]|uniref:hypothetical protein n=1 Tax=Chitinophaga filiformis TaxID=104663 RepID=UPI001F3B11FB|nr:hypothetical protein [Chitinophaga filiformis]MCF6402119.1 hypothetical protein [Chitinophaga filiformis]
MKSYSIQNAIVILSITIFSCAKPDVSKRSVQMITEETEKDSIFKSLINVVNGAIVQAEVNDSLAFLILPIEASCPSCREKTIDSILKHKENLLELHYIIISANGGKATVNKYFQEQHGELPVIENKLILDSSNQSYRLGLVIDRPTIYYTHNRKAYKKVSAIPVTVRDDLREFFSGSRK